MRVSSVVALLLLALSACSDATAPTLGGPSLFTALVDGMRFVLDPRQTPPVANTGAGALFVSEFVGDTSGSRALGFSLPNFHGVGRYALANAPDTGLVTGGNYSIYAGLLTAPLTSFSTDSAHRGEVDITAYDATNQIIVGTFAFEAAEVDGTRTVRVTHGEFRLHVYPLW